MNEEKKRRESGSVTAWLSWGCSWITYIVFGLAIVAFVCPVIAINIVREEVSKGNWVNVDVEVQMPTEVRNITLEEVTQTKSADDDEDEDWDDDLEEPKDDIDWDSIREEVEKKRMEAYEEAKRNGTLNEFEEDLEEIDWGFDDDEEDEQKEEPEEEDDEDFDEILVDRDFYDDKIDEKKAELEKLEKELEQQKLEEAAAAAAAAAQEERLRLEAERKKEEEAKK